MKIIDPKLYVLFFLCKIAFSCPTTIPTKGSLSVTACDANKDVCVSSSKAVHDYADIEDDSSTFSIAVQSSPWRMYDPNGRILLLDELAKLISNGLKPMHKSVVLMASWTGVSPSANDSSIASKLSSRLSGFPVIGQDGFLWLTSDGKTKTTRQAFTIYTGNYTKIRKGDDVFVSMTTSWAMKMENEFIKSHDHEGLLRAGLAWDVFGLCPEYALDRFEAASNNPVARYNSAIMRLDMNNASDSAKAIIHLRNAMLQGDTKAKELLQLITKAK